MENNTITSKLIRGDENTEHQNGTSKPLDVASCSASSLCLETWLCKFDPLLVMICACSIGGFIGIGGSSLVYLIWSTM